MATAALAKLQPLLNNKSITIRTKIRLLRAIVISTALYGCEAPSTEAGLIFSRLWCSRTMAVCSTSSVSSQRRSRVKSLNILRVNRRSRWQTCSITSARAVASPVSIRRSHCSRSRFGVSSRPMVVDDLGEIRPPTRWRAKFFGKCFDKNWPSWKGPPPGGPEPGHGHAQQLGLLRSDRSAGSGPGSATLTVTIASGLPAGSNTLKILYSGDSNYNALTATLPTITAS